MPTASELERGTYFIYNGEPVRVSRREVVAFGTHSHSKLKIFFQGLNEKGERSVNFQHTDKVEILDIIRKLGQVVSKSGPVVQIMDMMTYETLQAGVPAELMGELNEGDQITFVNIKGSIQVLEKR